MASDAELDAMVSQVFLDLPDEVRRKLELDGVTVSIAQEYSGPERKEIVLGAYFRRRREIWLYRGPLMRAIGGEDILALAERTLLHEIGHALGMGHDVLGETIS
jgi:predicted Zn-dependent protease with MMP-like domain